MSLSFHGPHFSGSVLSELVCEMSSTPGVSALRDVGSQPLGVWVLRDLGSWQTV